MGTDERKFYIMNNKLYEENVSVYAHELYYFLRTMERAYSGDIMTSIDFITKKIKFIESSVSKNMSKLILHMKELLDFDTIEILDGDYTDNGDVLTIRMSSCDSFTQLKPEIYPTLCEMRKKSKEHIPPKEFATMFKFVCTIEKWQNAKYKIPTTKDFCESLDITEDRFYNLRNRLVSYGMIKMQHGGWFEENETPKRKPNRYKNISY